MTDDRATDGSEIGTTDTSLTVRRTFDAPRERVWQAFTDREQVDQWWGPDGFTTTTDEMEVRPGGSWRFTMVGPDVEELHAIGPGALETLREALSEHGLSFRAGD